jgi:hypothetical protein
LEISLSAAETLSFEIGCLERLPFFISQFVVSSSAHPPLDLFISWLNSYLLLVSTVFA